MAGDSESTLESRLHEHLRQCGDEVVVVAPDSELERVGEDLMIAAHSMGDARVFGRLALQRVVRLLTGPRRGADRK